MKGGKEDDKYVRPMFPRVHVNDTDKGGPRAPPRNKMALYEQLSIPSQKFSTATLPPHKSGSAVPSALSIQGATHERTAYSPSAPAYTTTSSAEKPYSLSCDGKSIETRGMEFERSTGRVDYRTCAAGSGADGSTFNVHERTSGKNSFKRKYNDDDDDDFRVPTLAQSEVAPHSKDAPLAEVNRPAPFGSINVQNSTTLDSSIHVPSSSRKPIHEANACGKLSKKSKEHGDEFLNNPEAGEMFADPSKISLAPSDRGAETNMKFLDKAGCQSTRMGNESLHNGSVVALESLNDSQFLENRNASMMRSQLCSGASFGCSQGNYDKTNGSEELKDAERSCEVSEASMLDSISGLDISPDDVVGVIGPKQFWKARRAIVNQQRVFAIQVFELHRLIKVQKLFAASPHLLLEDSHIITIQQKVATKKVPIASSIHYQQVVQQTDHLFRKPSQNADPLVEKSAVPPLPDPNKELGQLLKNVAHSANTPPPIPMTPENRPNPWCFQPPANQWLIPVMSPSEGLIYKPYSGPCPPATGFMAPLYGSCGPLSFPSVSGDFMNAASHQQQNCSLPGSLAMCPNYFPAPYGMPMVNSIISTSAVDQVSPLANARPNGRTVQNSQSLYISITKSEALSGCPPKNNESKESELQVSTASSTCVRAQGEGRGVLPLFPVPPAPEGSCQPLQSSGKEHQTHVIKVVPHNARSATESPAPEGSCQPLQSSGKEHQTHVIKVVPHNARSATESAARIFRSIQKERQKL